MARTHKDSPYRYYNKEEKYARKQTNRKARKHNNRLTREAFLAYDDEDILFVPPPHTEGWETH